MRNVRDKNSVLTQSEIEALKVTQDVIKRMADNSSKTKTAFIALSVAVLTFSQGKMPSNFVLFGYLVFCCSLLVHRCKVSSARTGLSLPLQRDSRWFDPLPRYVVLQDRGSIRKTDLHRRHHAYKLHNVDLLDFSNMCSLLLQRY